MNNIVVVLAVLSCMFLGLAFANYGNMYGVAAEFLIALVILMELKEPIRNSKLGSKRK